MRKFGIIALLTIAATSAFAGETLKFTGGDYTGGYTLSQTFGATTLTEGGSAGLINVLYDDGLGNTTPYSTYCVSPFIPLKQDGSTWNVNSGLLLTDEGPTNPSGPSVSLPALTNQQVHDIAYLAKFGLGGDQMHHVNTQLAIWEVEGVSITGSPYDQNAINSLLASASSYTGAVNYQLFTPVDPSTSSQKLITAGGPDGNTTIESVPEPVSTCLGIAGIGVFIRRRAKKSA